MMKGIIPDAFIEDVLDRVDIVELIGGRVKLKRSGKNYMGLCPFHNEKSPSFSVTHDKQRYHCFGCGASGDAISFLQEHDNLTFPEAIEMLAQSAGLEVPKQQALAPDPNLEKKKALYKCLEIGQTLFRQSINTPEGLKARRYLNQRGIRAQTSQSFQLGFAPPGWQNLIDYIQPNSDNSDKTSSDKNQTSPPKKISPQLLVDSGMAIKKDKGGFYDRFRDRLMFPIRDSKGRIIAFGGRVLNDEKPKYLNSPETLIFQKSKELYGLYEARQSGQRLQRLLVVEGYMDVVSLFQHGITYAVATLGTATSDHHLEKIFKVVTEVVFCFDGDAAGNRAAQKAMEISLKHLKDGRQAKFLFLPDGEDPDTLIRSESKQAFEERILNAIPLPEQLFLSLQQDLALNTLDGKARLHQQATPLIEKIPSTIMRTLMQQQLADMTGLTLTQHSHTPEPRPPAAIEHEVYADTDFVSPPTEHPSAFMTSEEQFLPTTASYPAQQHDPSWNPYAEPRETNTFNKNNYPKHYKSQKNKHTAKNQPTPATRSSATAVTKILLQHPQLLTNALPNLQDLLSSTELKPDVLQMKALIEVIQGSHSPCTGGLLLHFQGSEYYSSLLNLAEQELLLSKAGIDALEKELNDAIKRMIVEGKRQQLQDQLRLLSNKAPSSLTQEERQILRQGLVNKRQNPSSK